MAYAERQAVSASCCEGSVPGRLHAPVYGHFKVLLTNDDGIHAQGLAQLAMVLIKEGYDVRIAAPVKEHSACGHAITLASSLRAKVTIDGRRIGLQVQNTDVVAAAVDGTPADCMKLALCSGMLSVDGKWHPDLVISGINKGANFGQCTVVSGTCAGARQASWQNVPAMAASLDCFETAAANMLYEEAAVGLLPVVEAMQTAIQNGQWPSGVWLNVNYPDTRAVSAENRHTDFLGRSRAGGPCKGIRVVCLSETNIQDDYASVVGGTQAEDHGDQPPWSEFKILGAKLVNNTQDGNLSEEMCLLGDGFLTISVVSGKAAGTNERHATEILKNSGLSDSGGFGNSSRPSVFNCTQTSKLFMGVAGAMLLVALLRVR